MSLQEDGMTSLIAIDITAALEGDEGTRVRCSSFREREDFGLDKGSHASLFRHFSVPQSLIATDLVVTCQSVSMTNLQSV